MKKAPIDIGAIYSHMREKHLLGALPFLPKAFVVSLTAWALFFYQARVHLV